MITTNIRTYATCPKCGKPVVAYSAYSMRPVRKWLHITPDGFTYLNYRTHT